ncbi:phosphatidylinositol 3 and 4-kinase-domain-containing protein [Pterulicium gracile]|uniref:Phosphatidylinositol 4-kinase n=1 Tax=Pterulicium gracile TaxID=1884261 RepID=A0A5C3QV78_9AGAR|nr:phosphatidylinositol 3 and 4-kinase-domain-containing protein [Pterula gracilis]
MSPAGYQQLSQGTDNEQDVVEQSSRPAQRHRTQRRPSIDLGKLDNAFRKWTDNIAQRVKRKKKVQVHTRKEIHLSVFGPTFVPPPDAHILTVRTYDHEPPMPASEYDAMVQSVKDTIADGIHPKMITKGSSGSYFARAKGEDARVHTVAVFKPKDEEPYGHLNPKTTKWLHRQLRWIIPFGRACLIPNLSYISEAAASLLDSRLNLYIVPPTQLVSLSSPAFFYDWIDRNGAKKGKPLPDKVGSLQYFMHGFQDASEFLRKHPWPGRSISDTFDDSSHRRGGLSKRFMTAISVVCGKTGDSDELYDDSEYDDERVLFDVTEDNSNSNRFYWSQTLQQSFRDELEKLVILDYLMLNTDRGADNYMIKYCEGEHEKGLVDTAPSRSRLREMPGASELKRPESSPFIGASPPAATTSRMSHAESGDYTKRPHIHIAAIDNSLSFPHEHPKGWRSYTYGWLYLPVSIIGRPFSEQTRNHFLPLLTSKSWWEETTYELRKLHALDPDFHPKMFRRQMAVMKGQAWNIVQSLKHADEGPLELTRRKKVLVWDDEVETAEVPIQHDPVTSSRASVISVPLPRHTRTRSSGEFPPPLHRTSTDATGAPRPVPFIAKFQRIHPGTTGVTVLEHLERLDAVEVSLQRLGTDADEPEAESDVGESASAPNSRQARPLSMSSPTRPESAPLAGSFASAKSLPAETSGLASPPLPTVHELGSSTSSLDEDEDDLAAMSRSMTHAELPNGSQRSHSRWASHAIPGPSRNPLTTLEWMNGDEDAESPKRTVIIERLEPIDTKPLCSCW